MVAVEWVIHSYSSSSTTGAPSCGATRVASRAVFSESTICTTRGGATASGVRSTMSASAGSRPSSPAARAKLLIRTAAGVISTSTTSWSSG